MKQKKNNKNENNEEKMKKGTTINCVDNYRIMRSSKQQQAVWYACRMVDAKWQPLFEFFFTYFGCRCSCF